ncbi:hypothetical protein [Priestia megaterium]|uniref:Uncharacterized protein n=1 Tax=Priestia megaterium TaxID=1404 RepID=A0A6M6DZF2_PRIMG|nr:hypothetical protein [Priestia megaterium]QJX80273.1 hypothetical protein FDZ14_29695 [Priestia megaterium]
MFDINKFNLKDVENKWINTGEIAPEEISCVFGAVEAKEDRLKAIYEEISSIPKEQCTPLVQEKIESILTLIKG